MHFFTRLEFGDFMDVFFAALLWSFRNEHPGVKEYEFLLLKLSVSGMQNF